MANPSAIVADQQKYAAEKDVPTIHETLLLSLIYTKPAEPLAHIAEEAAKLAADKSYQPTWPGRETDSEINVETYLASHKVHDILEEIFASVLFNKPAEPASFIQSEATRMLAQKQGAKPTTLYGESDLAAMFSLYDPVGRGRITRAQVTTAFKTLGLKQGPPATLEEEVDMKSFVEAATAALAEEKVL